jgi:hypothetical protein
LVLGEALLALWEPLVYKETTAVRESILSNEVNLHTNDIIEVLSNETVFHKATVMQQRKEEMNHFSFFLA